ncbi:IclR family transcriptional regulator [Rhodobacteraceae bacterium F11138]|nr:IclR family transcriptional regulator [Rhodobacteraceae bacterium F11138]
MRADLETAETENGPKPTRKGNQSLVTGFQIIDFLLKQGKAVPLRDISKGTGIASSKLQFYLISLIEVRVVHQDPESGYYGLGPYTLQLGIAGLQQFDIFDAARPRLDDFANEHGQSVFMGVWGNQGPTIVHRVSGHYSRTLLELRLGSVLPVLRSALGRVMFAYFPDDVTKPYIDRELSDTNQMIADVDPEMPAPRSAASLRDLRSAIKSIGMSRSRGGLLSDHTAVSAPIFDYRGKIIAGITVMGPVNGMDDSFDGPVAADLRRVAEEVSQEAGASTTHYLHI